MRFFKMRKDALPALPMRRIVLSSPFRKSKRFPCQAYRYFFRLAIKKIKDTTKANASAMEIAHQIPSVPKIIGKIHTLAV